jgi:nitrogen regulatory protein P-II 1
MKKIEAVIRPEKFAEVQEAIEKLGYPGITFTDVKGHGKQKGLIQQWRGREYKVDYLHKVKIEIVVDNGEATEKLIEAIVKVACTGEQGDGKIFVSTIDEVVRIRTGERGNEAI